MRLFFALSTLALLQAQQPSVVFRADINSVPVTVVVRDNDGRAIGNLTADSFRLFDNGKEQTISKFTVEKSFTRAESPVPAPTDAPAPKTPPPIPDRFIAYLFDDVHLVPGDLIPVRLAAIRRLAKLQPTDRAAIFTTSGNISLGFTSDREKLTKALQLIQPNGGSGMAANMMQCPPLTYYTADMIDTRNDTGVLDIAVRDAAVCGNLVLPRDQKRAESMARNSARVSVSLGLRDTLAAFETTRQLVQQMEPLPGTRAIVLVSPGFVVSLASSQAQNLLIEQAVRSNVVISSLNARGLYTENAGGDASTHVTNPATMLEKFRYQESASNAASGTLGELAYGTGGTLTENNNDMDEGLRRSSAAPDFLYILTFSPANLKLDGKYHNLKVTLNEPHGYSLQVRKGYYAPVPEKK